MKVQFEKIEDELNNKRTEILNQIKVLNDNYKNIDKISNQKCDTIEIKRKNDIPYQINILIVFI